ncbi:hypothetical protein GW17_00006507 [Ensete ventricosum]|nr:hypothetical protein GW17_00006507 [Ensete ventricosum]
MKSKLFEPPSRRREGGGAHDQDEADHGFRNPLELSLRISSGVTTCNVGRGDSGECRGLLATRDNLAVHQRDHGAKKWLPAEIHSGFIHPWSLAARQQKAVFEQASSTPRSVYVSPTPCVAICLCIFGKMNTCSSSSGYLAWIAVCATRDAHPSSSMPPPPLLVGWPPVRTSRKHLSLLKPGTDGENDAKRRKFTEREATTVLTTESRSRPAMFVKVNMEGYVVGRKIDLGAHESYRSLYRALSNLLHNFLSCTGARTGFHPLSVPNYSNNSGEQDDDFVLLYEDSEGDQMLVGDIPWEYVVYYFCEKALHCSWQKESCYRYGFKILFKLQIFISTKFQCMFAAGGEAQKTYHKQQLNH